MLHEAPGIVTALDPAQSAEMMPPAIETDGVTELAGNLPQPEALDRLYRPQILEAPVMTARDGPIAAIDPGLTDPAEPAPVAVAQAGDAVSIGATMATPFAASTAATTVAQAMLNGPQMPDGQMAVRTVAPDAPALELLASRPAWVRVTTADGTVLLEKIMDAGERFTLPKLEQPPLLRTGNSGAVYFAVNGRTYGPAAPGAQVVKNIELTPNNLTTTYAFADLAKDPELAEIVAVAQAGAVPQDAIE